MTMVKKPGQGVAYIAKPNASHSTPFEPLTCVLPLVRYGIEQEAVYLDMQILRSCLLQLASLVECDGV